MANFISVTLATLVLYLLFMDTRAQLEGCMCQAIDDNARGTVYTDFGQINTCVDLGFCACERQGVINCRRACERIVEHWARFECPGGLRQREVRAQYAAGQCKLGLGDNTHNCRVRRLNGFFFGNPAVGVGANGGNAAGPPGGCCPCNAWMLDNI